MFKEYADYRRFYPAPKEQLDNLPVFIMKGVYRKTVKYVKGLKCKFVGHKFVYTICATWQGDMESYYCEQCGAEFTNVGTCYSPGPKDKIVHTEVTGLHSLE